MSRIPLPSPRLPRMLAVLAAVGLATACHSWKPAPLAPTPSQVPGHGRAQLTDGRMLQFSGYRVTVDSLSASDPPFAVPLDSVKQLEVRTTDIGRTVLLIVSVPVALGALFTVCESCLLSGGN